MIYNIYLKDILYYILMKELIISKVKFKVSEWKTADCRRYLHHLNLKPIRKVFRENYEYIYIIQEVDKEKTEIIKDDNSITLYYLK